MTNLLATVFFLSSVLLPFHLCQGQLCPPIYLRYSQKHTCNQPSNSSCPIFQSAVGPAEIKQILDVHNKYRNLVAMGEEKRARGLPQAADMMQMVWDPELAITAQKKAEQCNYEHDCADCRRVENFPVGQSIGRRDFTCQMGLVCDLNSVPNWAEVIKLFIDEIAVFDPKYLTSVELPPGIVFGHFTQVIWSKTWRIGCGNVAFKNGTGYGQIYVCNYGPSGNVLNTPVYEFGPTCSGCPVNSCCGKTCILPEYPGLCRMNNIYEGPIYRTDGNFIFYCDFRIPAEDCSNSVIGPNKWRFVNALGGAYEELVLNGGEMTGLKFSKAMKSSKQALCLSVRYRFGPAVEGMKKSGKASVTLEVAGNPKTSTMILPTPSNREFFNYNINIGWNYETLVSIMFSVPVGDPPQFFHVQLVTAKEGKC